MFFEKEMLSFTILDVVELKGDGKFVAQHPFAVFTPDQEGIVENAAVHTYGAVQLCVDNGGGADNHAVC